jgi:MbtH protein
MENISEDWDYKVLINHEEQYCIWPHFKAVPDGWNTVGPVADKATCLSWIEEHWTDLRPKSIRGALQSK